MGKNSDLGHPNALLCFEAGHAFPAHVYLTHGFLLGLAQWLVMSVKNRRMQDSLWARKKKHQPLVNCFCHVERPRRHVTRGFRRAKFTVALKQPPPPTTNKKEEALSPKSGENEGQAGRWFNMLSTGILLLATWVKNK